MRLIKSLSLSVIAVFSIVFLIAIASVCLSATQIKPAEAALDETGGVLVLSGGGAKIEIAALERGVVSVEVFAPELNSGFETYMTVPGALGGTKITNDTKSGEASAGNIRIKYELNPFAISFSEPGGKELLRLVPDGITVNDDGSYEIKFNKSADDRFFGLGEPQPGMMGDKKIPLDMNRQKVAIWNIHPQAYIGMPFFMNPKGYGLLVADSYKAEFDFTGRDSFVYRASGGPLKFYVFPSHSFYEILDEYTQLTGRAPIPPRWATGFMLSGSQYMNEEHFKWRMENFRKRLIPGDVFIFDNYWSQQDADESTAVGNLRWHEKNFPNPLAFQKEVHANGFKTAVIVQPYISDNAVTFEEAKAKKLGVTDDKGNPFLMCGNCYWKRNSLLLDFMNPATRDWYGKKIKEIHDTGVDAWWTDLDEPEWDSDDMVFSGGLRRGAAHNLQAVLMHKSMFDEYRKDMPDERVFILSRSGFVGDWRYGAAIWSGDVHTTWFQFTDQIPIAMNTALSGFGLWNSDVGGFISLPSPELFVRWMQFGAFCPIFRAHGGSPREPWVYGDEAEKDNREILNLRYRLSPYLYSLFYEMHAAGKPIMRPMLLEFPDDEKSYSVNNQFMYGPWLLVAPVTKEKAVSRKVYLPAGRWTNFQSGKTLEGPGVLNADAPLDTIPVFVREGAILTLGPLVQYIGEKPVDPLEVHYYPSSTETTFEMYEDDGVTRAYERGEFSLTTFRAKAGGGGVVLSTDGPKGTYKGKPDKRAYSIFIHNVSAPKVVIVDEKKVAPSDFAYDAGARLLTVKIPETSGNFRVEMKN